MNFANNCQHFNDWLCHHVKQNNTHHLHPDKDVVDYKKMGTHRTNGIDVDTEHRALLEELFDDVPKTVNASAFFTIQNAL